MSTTCMDGPCHKSCQWMVSNGEKTCLDSMNNSSKTMTKTVDVKYPKELHNLHNDLSFLSEIMKTDKCEKLVCNLYNKKNVCMYT